jgi:hypothetical protein
MQMVYLYICNFAIESPGATESVPKIYFFLLLFFFFFFTIRHLIPHLIYSKVLVFPFSDLFFIPSRIFRSHYIAICNSRMYSYNAWIVPVKAIASRKAEPPFLMPNPWFSLLIAECLGKWPLWFDSTRPWKEMHLELSLLHAIPSFTPLSTVNT